MQSLELTLPIPYNYTFKAPNTHSHVNNYAIREMTESLKKCLLGPNQTQNVSLVGLSTVFLIFLKVSAKIHGAVLHIIICFKITRCGWKL